MKNILLKKILLALTLITFNAHAQMYKGVDAEGNVVYSDKPFADAKQFTPPAITVIDPIEVPVKKEEVVKEEEPSTETKYKNFSISAPKNDETIRNVPNLSVSLKLNPKLNTKEGHTIWLFMDGKPLIKNSKSLLLQVGRVDRGEHTLQAHVRNKKGQVIKQTRSITVHVKNSVVRRIAN
ncbi:MAG: DUF4124 domain-containing protein [Gammaproteobacteria bacterium]|nr:DUF4124 domain-containing protein [Gammaproteobacteria bacterium]